MTTHLASRDEIGLRPRRSVSYNTAPRGGTLHYMGNSPWPNGIENANHDRCYSIWRSIQSQHMADPGAADIYYSSGVCPHGVRLEGRGPGVRHGANGDTEGNRISYAVCILAGDDDIMTDAMIWGLLDEEDRYGFPFAWPHSDWYATACCGNDGRLWLSQGRPRPDGSAPGTPPTPELPPEIDMASALVQNVDGRMEFIELRADGNLYIYWEEKPNAAKQVGGVKLEVNQKVADFNATYDRVGSRIVIEFVNVYGMKYTFAQKMTTVNGKPAIAGWHGPWQVNP